jgi:hypothetical protein
VELIRLFALAYERKHTHYSARLTFIQNRNRDGVYITNLSQTRPSAGEWEVRARRERAAYYAALFRLATNRYERFCALPASSRPPVLPIVAESTASDAELTSDFESEVDYVHEGQHHRQVAAHLSIDALDYEEQVRQN